MFTAMYNASTLEDLKKAYRIFVKYHHPDLFYHTGDETLIEMHSSYMKQAHKLYEERVKEIEEQIAMNLPPTTATYRKGIHYKEDIKVSEVCEAVKAFCRDIATRFCTFNCYTKSGILFVYASKGSMLLNGYQVVSEDFLDYIESKYPEHFKNTALFILSKINQYRIIKKDRTSNFKVVLSIGKSEEQPYRRLKSAAYIPHNTSYWIDQVKNGQSDFSSIPKRYRTEGFVTLCITSSEKLAEEIIDLFPELLTKDSIGMVRKAFPNLRKKLPKQQSHEAELKAKVIQLSVEAFKKYAESQMEGLVLIKVTEECLGLVTVSSGQVASYMSKHLEPNDENFKIIASLESDIYCRFMYKPLQALLMRKAKRPEESYIWNPVTKVWEEK